MYFLRSVQVMVTVCSGHRQTPQLIHCNEADVLTTFDPQPSTPLCVRLSLPGSRLASAVTSKMSDVLPGVKTENQ